MRRVSIHKKIHKDRGLPLTPLIDMVFLVMIFFVINTSFTIRPVIDLQLPKAGSGDAALTNPEIDLYIDTVGDLFLNEKQISIEALIAALSQESPKVQIYIHSDKFTPYGNVLEVLDRLRLNSYTNIFLVTEKQGS